MAQVNEEKEVGEKQAGFSKVISLKDCVGCKLFSVPLLYLFGLHIGLKNYNLL